MFEELIALLTVFTGSLLLTHLVWRHACHRQWLDVPNHRSSHSRPVPRSGGVGFALVYLLFVCWLSWRGMGDLLPALWLVVALLGVMGLADDMRPLPVRLRLCIQVLCAGLLLWLVGGFPALPFPGAQIHLGWYGFIPGVLALVWLINLYNFMDGIDGLAATEAIFVAGASLLLFRLEAAPPALQWMSAGLALSVSAFLLLNLPPARIFMGDVGSNFLGGGLAVLALLGAHAGIGSLWTWLILLAVFIVDSSYTLLHRMWQGELWYDAHRSHAYQRAAIRLGGHGRVVAFVAMINVLWLLPLAYVSVVWPAHGVLLSIVACAPLVWLCHHEGAGISSHGEGQHQDN